MVTSWIKEDIEAILLQLNERELPFKKTVFSSAGGTLKCLGKGGAALVYEAEERRKQKKKYAIKVIGFGEQQVEPAEFQSSVALQKELGEYRDTIVKVYDSAQFLVWIEGDHRVVRTEAVDAEQKARPEGNCLLLQFILLEKLEPVLQAGKHYRPILHPALKECKEQEILKFACEVGGAIAQAHKKGLLHRDIKPENIFYSPEKRCYKLGDFGIAKVLENGWVSSRACTGGYGAPEVILNMGERYDETADIYSFGMTLYVLLNRLRFPHALDYRPNYELQYTPGYEPPEPVDGSDDLVEVVLRMIRSDPDERYQSMEAVLNELDRLRYGRHLKFQREHKNAVLTFGGAFALLGVCLWSVSFQKKLVTDFSFSIGLLCALCILRGGIALFGKTPVMSSLAAFGVGLYVVFQRGFTWKGLLLVFLVTLVFDMLSAVLGGCVLCEELTDLAVKNMQLPVESLTEYRWAAVLLLSLAVFLLFHHVILRERKESLVRMYLEKNMMWIMAAAIYAELILLEYSMRHSGAATVDIWGRIFGTELCAKILSLHPAMVGACGAVFCIAWMLREWFLVLLERWQEQKKKYGKFRSIRRRA